MPERVMKLDVDWKNVRGVLLDWDGCCALENKLLPAAVKFLKVHERRSAIVSNNSTNTPADFARILIRHGVRLKPERIHLAGYEAIKLAKKQGARRVLLLASPRLTRSARSHGLGLVENNADLVVLARDLKFSYARLTAAINSLEAGARLIISNPDATHPGQNGQKLPETGALLAAIERCVDLSAVETINVGKPHPRLFKRARQSLDHPAATLLMVGDNPHTDIAGAEASGMRALLVGDDPSATFEELARRLKTA